MSKSRQYKSSDIKRLFALSGNECAEPKCIRKLIAEDGLTVIGKICHIEAASKNGPRYRGSMTDEERRDFKNLILLCDEHHQIIDNKQNVRKYSVKKLQGMKKSHETLYQNQKFEVRREHISQVINELKEIHFEVKESHKTILKIESRVQGIADSLNEISQNTISLDIPVLVQGYVKRTEETQLWNIIEEKNILLLSGISFCGKSQLAKKIARKLVDQGFAYSHGNDVDEAERFLRSQDRPRVYLLDDPFGHNSETEKSPSLRKVAELIKNLHSSHKLVITSRSEVLKSINHATSLDECSLEGNHWIDLTTSNSEFLLKTWNSLSRRKGIPVQTTTLIKEYLQSVPSDKNALQAGHLNHLSNIPRTSLKDKTLEELLYLAKADSKEISLEVQRRGMKAYELFTLLGLGATTEIPISLAEIGYIISKSQSQPGFLVEGISSFTHKTAKPSLPQYPEAVDITEEVLTELAFLQTRGFIRVSNQKVWFAHPTYREAARYMLSPYKVDQLNSINRLIGNTLSCLNPKTGSNCSKQLYFIYRNSSNPDLSQILRHHALVAVDRSIFPGVKDICFSFLLSIINDLSEDERNKLLRRLKLESSDEGIYWHDETPFFDPHYINFSYDILSDSEKENRKTAYAKLNENQEVATSLIWDLLIQIQYDTSLPLPNSVGLQQILSCNEVFIRGQISFLIMRKAFLTDLKILNTIFNDPHPAVIFEGVKGALLGLPGYSNEERTYIKPYLIQALSNPLVVIRANSLLSTFGIDYGAESIAWEGINEEDRKIIWNVWGELFCIFLKNYPPSISFENSGRFSITLDESIKYLSVDIGLNICAAYYEWIENRLQLELPDSHELGLLPYLIEITDKHKKKRFNLFKKILKHKDTSYITYSLRWCVGYWNKLTPQETKYVLALLNEDRRDREWLIAVCLTQEEIPGEIQELIFNNPQYFNQDIATIIKSFNNQLLLHCLHIFCGYPQPLWRLGFHHNNEVFWQKVMIWILKNDYPVGFGISLKEFVNDTVNGQRWADNDISELWHYLCQNSKDKKQLASRLIYETASCSCVIPPTQMLWRLLINAYKENDTDELIDMIIQNIGALQNFNADYLFDILDVDFFYERILPRLQIDQIIIDFLLGIRTGRIITIDTAEKIVEGILLLTQNSEVELEITFRIIKDVVKSHSEKYPSIKKLEGIANKINETRRIQLQDIGEDYNLENWNFLLKNSH